jgi:hypothetical protein
MEYQVEYTTDNGIEHVKPFAAKLAAAKAAARKASATHGTSYVVALTPTEGGGTAAVGHFVFANGYFEFTEGVVAFCSSKEG